MLMCFGGARPLNRGAMAAVRSPAGEDETGPLKDETEISVPLSRATCGGLPARVALVIDGNRYLRAPSMPNCPRPSTSIADISAIYRATCAPSAQRAPLTSRISGWPKSVKQLAVPHRLDPLAICQQSTPKPSSLPTRNKALRIRTRVPIARRLPKRTNTTLGWLVRAVWVLRKGGANRSRGGPLSEFFL